ncbi:MAG: hypothetical protein OEY01_11145 [Desulfobulbaceae bacterium]|nr:hypothetical protein [Desulfobulbaceae bacterium]
MKHDTIDINGATYRVEFNWNATVDFLETEGLNLTDADSLDNLKPSQITSLIYAGVKEGARMEAKDFPFTVKDFGAALGFAEVAALLEIFKAHTAVKTTAKKKTKPFYRRK